MEVYGEFFICCRIHLKFYLRVRLKPSNDRVEIELNLAKCNKNIAEKSFSLGHRTDSNCNFRVSMVEYLEGFNVSFFVEDIKEDTHKER